MDAISFVTFFLGLVVGIHPVEVVFANNVAALEVVLDGNAVAKLDRPATVFPVDFGAELRPHKLEVIARAADGTELGRARQWINLPRSPAKVSLSVQTNPQGGCDVARLDWENAAGEPPASISLAIDGAAIPVTDLDHIELPVLDSHRSHLLRADVVFPSRLAATAELLLGVGNTNRSQSQLTAVPLSLRKVSKFHSADQLEGWLENGGNRLTPVAIEAGTGEIVMVISNRAQSRFRDIANSIKKRFSTTTPLLVPDRNLRNFSASLTRRNWIDSLVLPSERHLRFVWPVPHPRASEEFFYNVFPSSDVLSRESGELLFLLHQATPKEPAQGVSRLADSVAVAGLMAAAKNHRRAVVLVLTDETMDASQHSPQGVRAYLEDLRVPLIVWRLDSKQAAHRSWGKATRVTTPREFAGALDDVEQILARQRIVWVQGAFLPHQIELTSVAKKATLAGTLPG